MDVNQINDIMLELPEDSGDVIKLLDETPINKIFLTSDWHINAHKYGKTDTKIKLKEMLEWCRKHIEQYDIFFYLGDICFRYANEEDSKEAQDIMKSIPGRKILIIGNHDAMQGENFYLNCGFDYVFDELIWHNIIFTHKPVRIESMPGVELNIHGHLHDNTFYMTTDGKDNVNVFNKTKPFTLEYLLTNIKEKTKDNVWKWNSGFGESFIEKTKRSELPDSAFGDPENRKYPLDTEQHVKSAIKLYGHGNVSDKKLLAKRISAAAKRYNIKIDPDTQVAKALQEANDLMLSYPKDTITINTDDGIQDLNISKIKYWFADSNRIPECNEYEESCYKKSLNDAVTDYIPNDTEAPDAPKSMLYIFICNGQCNDWQPICVGIVEADQYSYDWLIQYPVYMDESGCFKSIHNEFSLASINPVKGFTKPFIIKAIPNKMDCTINAKQYMFSPDIISDKYLVIDEDAHLKVVPSSEVADYYIESEYEYIGDIQNFLKIFDAYRENKTVDQTFFYTALTSKPMLTEDQIDFDPDFKRVDFQGIKFSILAELATNANILNRSITPFTEAAVEVYNLNDDERRLYKKYEDYGLHTNYSIEGYFVESNLLDRRSAYVNSHDEVNEALIMSVIGGN